jgi:hypothetical protein
VLMGLLHGTMACSSEFFGTSQPVMMLCWRRGRSRGGGDVLQVQDVMVVVISSLIIVPYSIIIMFLFRGGTCDSNVRTKTELVAVELEIGQLSLARSLVRSFIRSPFVCVCGCSRSQHLLDVSQLRQACGLAVLVPLVRGLFAADTGVRAAIRHQGRPACSHAQLIDACCLLVLCVAARTTKVKIRPPSLRMNSL